MSANRTYCDTLTDVHLPSGQTDTSTVLPQTGKHE